MYRITFLFIAAATLLSCSAEKKVKLTEAAIKLNEPTAITLEFDWLVNNWIRVREEGENTTYESWSKKNDSTYSGWGYAIAAGDTVFQEHMLFRTKAERWQLEVISPGEELPTIFKMSQYNDSSFTVENPAHDFPTAIRYFTVGDSLKAEVSSAEMTIDFTFIADQ
jgi:hypothetical protein